MPYEPFYHAQADIEELFRQARVTFTDATAIKPADLLNRIQDTEVYVNNRLVVKYPVPITDPEAKNQLREICASLTASKVWRMLNIVSQGGGANMGKDWEATAENKLRMIVSGDMALGGLGRNGSGSPGGGLRSGTLDSTPTWEMNKVQW
jgi:hypothetical protein